MTDEHAIRIMLALERIADAMTSANQPTQSEHELLTIDETATFLRLSRAKAYQLTGSGELPTVRMGRSVRVRRDQLVMWLDEHSR